MVPPSDSVRVMAGGGKYPLPSPLFCRVRIFSLKGIGQCHVSKTQAKIFVMLPLDPFDVVSKRFLNG